jgi:hypothetical protein
MGSSISIEILQDFSHNKIYISTLDLFNKVITANVTKNILLYQNIPFNNLNSSIIFDTNISSVENSFIVLNIANSISDIITTSLKPIQKSALVSKILSEYNLTVDDTIKTIITKEVIDNSSLKNIQACIIQTIPPLLTPVSQLDTIISNCIFNSIQGSGILATIATKFGLTVVQYIPQSFQDKKEILEPSSPKGVNLDGSILSKDSDTSTPILTIIIVIFIIIFIVIILIIFFKYRSKSKLIKN